MLFCDWLTVANENRNPVNATMHLSCISIEASRAIFWFLVSKMSQLERLELKLQNKKIEKLSIKDRLKLAKALNKQEVWTNLLMFLRTEYNKDIENLEPSCKCQCPCNKCGRLGINHHMKTTYSYFHHFCA